MLVASCREPSAVCSGLLCWPSTAAAVGCPTVPWDVPLCRAVSREHVGPHGALGSGGPCESQQLSSSISPSHTCGCKAACMGCVTWSLCLITVYFQAALLQLCSTAAICMCGWQWWGKSHPLSGCPLIHPADEWLPACLADSAGRAVAPCQGLLKSSHHIDWPCHHLRDVFL